MIEISSEIDTNIETEKVKLTKSVLNKFIIWTTTKYNDWLGYGTKKENVEIIFNSLIAGHYVGWRGKREENKKIFTIQCASPVGENSNGKARGRGASNKYWKTKQCGDTYNIDCEKLTIEAVNSKRILKLFVTAKAGLGQD